jgi:hypothetical protein
MSGSQTPRFFDGRASPLRCALADGRPHSMSCRMNVVPAYFGLGAGFATKNTT